MSTAKTPSARNLLIIQMVNPIGRNHSSPLRKMGSTGWMWSSFRNSPACTASRWTSSLAELHFRNRRVVLPKLHSLREPSHMNCKAFSEKSRIF